MPSSCMPRKVEFCRSKRMTTASPCSIGITETRMSTSASSIADLDAAVLGQALLRDVQMAENLDARNDGRLKALELCRDRHFLQHAVNPVTDAELILEGFEVNVRGAQLDGIAQDLVHEPDDRGVLGRVVEVAVLFVVASSTTSNGASLRPAYRSYRRRRPGASSSPAGWPRPAPAPA